MHKSLFGTNRARNEMLLGPVQVKLVKLFQHTRKCVLVITKGWSHTFHQHTPEFISAIISDGK